MHASLTAILDCAALHPTLPFAAFGDWGGNLYLVDLVGIAYGPLIATAVDQGTGPMVRCPACWNESSLDQASLGNVIDCPTPACDVSLRVNPFVVRRSSWLSATENG